MNFQEIQVLFDSGIALSPVGTLAISGNKVLFEYKQSWLANGIELSPLQLPISRKSFQFEASKLVNAIPGLFADSLPDGWGMLIMDRFFAKQGRARHLITPLDRLAYLGSNAMGALCYQPSIKPDEMIAEAVNIGAAAKEAYDLYEGRIEDAGRLLNRIGGSPGGARPKALIAISDNGREFLSGTSELPLGYTFWLVKFSGHGNSPLGCYEGVMEYIYLTMAQFAGISVPEYRLITDDQGLQHIAVRRFDRSNQNERLHVATASGLLNADYRSPTLDYHDLLKLAWVLTKDASQVSQQYIRAAFNLFANNRDDHAKNHGYLMDSSGRWHLSPAYDLTYSEGPNGEHWTAYRGEGRDPTVKSLLDLADLSSISKKDALTMIDQVQSALDKFSFLCREYDVPQKYSNVVAERLKCLAG